jgi:hypothetical protein
VVGWSGMGWGEGGEGSRSRSRRGGVQSAGAAGGQHAGAEVPGAGATHQLHLLLHRRAVHQAVPHRLALHLTDARRLQHRAFRQVDGRAARLPRHRPHVAVVVH